MTMPPKPNTKETKILMSELTLMCEWDDCSQQFHNMEEFLSHMCQHLIGHHYKCATDTSGNICTASKFEMLCAHGQ